MDAIDVLMEARAYIEKGWCQGALARSDTGEILYWSRFDTDRAVSWCAIGALVAAQTKEDFAADDRFLHKEARKRLREVLGLPEPFVSAFNDGSFDPLADWNDAPERTQSEVLEAFDRAIALGLDREREGG